MADVNSADVRHIALDAHKRYGVFLGVNPQAEVVLPARRVDWPNLEGWIKQHLKVTDIVIIEATTNTWHLYDLIKPHVAKVKIANASRVKVLGADGVKTDSRDALHLARLSAANLLPEVWVPPLVIRELRQLMAHRGRLIKQRSMFKNRLSAVLQRHAITPPEKDLFHVRAKGRNCEITLNSQQNPLDFQDTVGFEGNKSQHLFDQHVNHNMISIILAGNAIF